MNGRDRPTCWVIAGPNGAGKTTFALKYLPAAGCQNFVNADLIAAGMAPLAPERERMSAGRLFLTEVQRHIQARHDFGVELVYLALPTPDMAKRRVAERVSHGGHDIAQADIERRFFRSWENLIDVYASLVDRTVCSLNSGDTPDTIFIQQGKHREVVQPAVMRLLQRRRL
jgi:predicted ABC-type ATPase